MRFVFPRLPQSWRYSLATAKRNTSFVIGGTIVLAFVLISLLNVFIPAYLGVKNVFDLANFSNLQTSAPKSPLAPSFDHGWLDIFGTTLYRVPILPVILAGVTVDLAFAVPVAGASAIIGLTLGVLSTYSSRRLETTLVGVMNAITSIPLLISVIIFGFLTSFSIMGLAVGMIFVLWSYYGQISRNLTLEVKNKQYVEAARASGASGLSIVFGHIFPNISSPILVRYALDLATVIVIFSAVNFIFYTQFTSLATLPELGSLMAGLPGLALKYRLGPGISPLNTYVPLTTTALLLDGYWWTVVFPMIFLVVLVAGLITFSAGLRELLDPKTRY